MADEDRNRDDTQPAAPKVVGFAADQNVTLQDKQVAKRQAVSQQMGVARKIMRRDAVLLQSLATK